MRRALSNASIIIAGRRRSTGLALAIADGRDISKLAPASGAGAARLDRAAAQFDELPRDPDHEPQSQPAMFAAGRAVSLAEPLVLAQPQA